jgi:hypothetical protein
MMTVDIASLPLAAPEGFKSDLFDWRACELLAREYERSQEPTDAACIRLGLPIDSPSHKALLALTTAMRMLDATNT